MSRTTSAQTKSQIRPSSEAKQDEQLGVRDDDLELELLTALFIIWYGTVLRSVHTLTVRVLNLGPVPLDDAAVRHIILEARAAAVAVDATTRRLIAQRIADGASMGLTPRQIAYGTDDFPGISGLFRRTWKDRPLTVAKTELQKAQLRATVQRFQTLGRGLLTGWFARDGDFDAYCSGRNGKRYPPNSPPDLAHPHCRLTLTPILGL